MLYAVRLVVTDASGRSFEDRITLRTDYVAIESPRPPHVPSVAAVFKPGATLSIVGKATGPSFQRYRLDWEPEGGGPSEEGLSLTGGGSSPVSGAELATWAIPTGLAAGYYSIRLTVENEGFWSEARTLVYLEPDLASFHWPVFLDQAPDSGSGALPARDETGTTRLVLTSPVWGGFDTLLPPWLHTFSVDGSSHSTFPLDFTSYEQPAVGDIDGQPGQETVVTDSYRLHVVREDGSSFDLVPEPPAMFESSLVVLEDLDRDGRLEVLACGYNPDVSLTYVYAWRSDGQQVGPSFPLAVQDYYPRLTVVDLDGDGGKEILVVDGNRLRAFRSDGTPFVWPEVTLPGRIWSLAVADLDHDGSVEIVLVTSADGQVAVHVLDATGAERPGWPAGLANNYFPRLAIGDVDGNERDEVVVANSFALYVFGDDGRVRWVRDRSWEGIRFGQPVLADVTGDNQPEIILVEEAHGYYQGSGLAAPLEGGRLRTVDSESNPAVPEVATGGWHPTPWALRSTETSAAPRAHPSLLYHQPNLIALDPYNNVIRSWRLLGANGNQPHYDGTPVVGDLDQDGTTDVAVSYQTIAGGGVSGGLREGVLTVLNVGTPYRPGASQWPTVFQNPRNTAVRIPAPPGPRILSLEVTGGGTVTVTPPGDACDATASICTFAYEPGSVVLLEAMPAPGEELLGWQGACSGDSPRCYVEMDSDRSVSAQFAAIPPGASQVVGPGVRFGCRVGGPPWCGVPRALLQDRLP